MARHKQKNNGKWFIRVRGSYLPSSGAGWLTYIPYTAYLVVVPAYVLSKRYDPILSLFVVVPNWVAAVAVMNWVAARKS